MVAMAFLCCGCLSDAYRIITEETKKESPSEDKPEDNPQTGGVKEYSCTPAGIFGTEVKELSSICFNAAGDGFYAVSDEGNVYEIGLDGKTRKTLYSQANHDWEAVDVIGDNIYLMEETESSLYKMSSGKLTLVSRIEIPGGGASGKGPEGMMCVQDIVYVGNQASPTRIVKYSLKMGKTDGYFDIDFVSKYISDLCYDSVDKTMWLVDSKGPSFYHCTLDGKLIARYNIPFVKQAEAIAIDHAAGIAWIGCDSTSNLYKIKIEI